MFAMPILGSKGPDVAIQDATDPDNCLARDGLAEGALHMACRQKMLDSVAYFTRGRPQNRTQARRVM